MHCSGPAIDVLVATIWDVSVVVVRMVMLEDIVAVEVGAVLVILIVVLGRDRQLQAL